MEKIYEGFNLEDPMIEYVTLKIKSTIDNKFFDYNIKKIEDKDLLHSILDKTSKSFLDLEKAFVSFLETGKTNFMVTKDLVKWTNDNKKTTNTIECSIKFPIGKSYDEYIKYSQNDITSIINYIKTAEIYSKPIMDKHSKLVIDNSLKDIKIVLTNLQEGLKNKEYYLDEVFKDFKKQLISIFIVAVSVRSNNLINVDELKDRITVNLTNVTKEDIVDGYYDKLHSARNNFLNNARVVVEKFLKYDNLSDEEKDIENFKSKEVFKDFEARQRIKKIHLKKKYDVEHEKLVTDINNENIDFSSIVSEIEKVKQVDPDEFFNNNDNIFENLVKTIDDEKEIDLTSTDDIININIKQVDPIEFFDDSDRTSNLIKKIKKINTEDLEN